MNIPAVRVAQMITPNVLVETLSALGFTGLNSGDDYGVSLALGTADISLWELVRAYRTLANQGLTSDLKVSADRVLNEAPPRRTFSDVTAYRIAHILSDREARAETFGLENALGTRFWSAVKTGTSKDMRDNWCVGFSSRYTVGVWVGNFDGSAMWDVSGVSGAAPIWLGLMKKLHENEPSVERERPVLLGESDEQPLVPLSKEVFGHIVSPASGTISVLDPDIPVEKRKMLFQSDSTGGSAGNSAANSRSDSKWVLDGHVIAKSDRPFLWNPRPGPHHLQLVGRSGETEDEVVFTVR
jgi:penicillin-binding protein 1C